jgi:outer membrane biosynthesis protein TonB
MMKRRFTTITTILAGALAGNTAFFATQAIATQEMQPTAQVADQYMIIDLENIPLAQAQNNMDALIPDDAQLTEDSSSLSEQDEFEMSTELADQSESSVLEETLPYYLSLSSIDVTKVAYFDKLDGLESSLSQTDPDIAGTLTYAVSDICAGEPMISYLLDQYAGYDTYSAVEFCEAASLQQADESGMYRLLLQQEEGADVVHYSMSDGTLQKTAVDSYVNEYGAPAVSLDANTNHWLIVHLTPEVSTPNESSAAGENQEETDEAASQSLEGKVDEDTSETTSQDVAKADPTKPSKPSEKSSSESATKPTKPTTKAPGTTKPASTKPAQTTKAPETAATVAPTAATTAPPTTSPAPTTTQTPTVTTTTAAQTTAPTTTAHTHNWVAVTKTVHHDAVTSQVWKEDSAAWDETVVTKAAWDEQVLSQEAYDEQVLVSEAYDEPVYAYVEVCNACGHAFLDPNEDVLVHMAAGCWSSWHGENRQVGTTHHDAVYSTVHHDAVYTTVHHDAETTVVHHDATGHYETVVTQAAWDETVTTGYKCSGCGATK